MALQIDAGELDPGRVHQVNVWGIKQDPVPHYLDWLERGPFYTVMDGNVPSAVFARYRDVEAIHRDFRRFSSVKPKVAGLERLDYFNGQPNLAYIDPPDHTRLRRLVQPGFSSRLVEGLVPGIEAKIDDLLAEAEASGPSVEFMHQVAHPLSASTLLGLFLGVPEEGHAVFDELTHAIYLLNSVKAGGVKPDEYLRAWQRGADYSMQLVEEVRRNPREDVITAVVNEADTGSRITGDELLGMLLALYVGGLSSVAAFQGNALVLLGQHPDQQALLKREPELVDAAFDEIMRMDSPGTVTFRFATEDMEFAGLPLWKDMPVYISQQATGYDATVYEDPLRFDVTRRPKMLQFGGGVHLCIGAPIARLVFRCLMTAVNRRWPAWRLDPPDQPFEFEGFPGERLRKQLLFRID